MTKLDIVSLAHNVRRSQKLTHSASFWAQKLTHYVSFWVQKTLKWAIFCSNGSFLFLMKSYIIKSMFKLFFSFYIGQNCGNNYLDQKLTECVSFWPQNSLKWVSIVSGQRNWHYGREILNAKLKGGPENTFLYIFLNPLYFSSQQRMQFCTTSRTARNFILF